MGTSPRLRLAIVLGRVRLLCLGLLALLLAFSWGSRVGAVTFAFSGFEDNYFHLVSNSSWIFNSTTGCIGFYATDYNSYYSTFSGRFLYPFAVQMIDPGATTVKSFSASFIYQIQSLYPRSRAGPGLAFIIVPDNVNLGAPGDFMGLITEETAEIAKNYAIDNHTFGVELDTYMNYEFQDVNNNHIGINLASMNSTFSLKPVYTLFTTHADEYLQIWIDYSETDSRMDIYYARYEEGKPAEPQGSQSGLDLSLLKESMHLGFSTAHKMAGNDVPYVCAWSFSNDGIPAPSITIAKDATPGAPAPQVPVTPGAPPPQVPVTPAPPPRSPPPVPPRSPAVAIPSPPPPAANNPPPLRTSNPPPLKPPGPPPPSSIRPQGPTGEPPTIAKTGGQKEDAKVYVFISVGVFLFAGLGLFTIVFRCWLKFLGHPLCIFISHAGDKDGSGKRFPIFLYDGMRRYTWSISKLNIKFFLDKKCIKIGEIIADRIKEELDKFDVGLVVVTAAFFTSKWPMTELIAFVESQMNDPTRRLRVLPLFYELTPDDIKFHLREETWESDWEKMSTDDHPLEVEKCRLAVKRLCSARGIVYDSTKRDNDDRYIEEICEGLDGILREERSFTSYIWRTKIRPCCF